MQVGDRLRLQGKTRGGKNTVHNRGAHWKVIKIDKPLFDKVGRDDWLLLENVDGKGDLHWVRATGDENFIVEVT